MKKMKNIWGSGAILIIVTSLLVTFAVSCKKSDSEKITFTGTYFGTLTMGFYSEADTIAISAGSTSTAVVMTSQTEAGSTFTLNGTVDGTNLTIPEQSVYDSHLNETYTVSGTGTLDNQTGSLIINYKYVTSSSSIYYWQFNGIKII